MSNEGSDTLYLQLLKAGDRDAAGPLWQRYFRLLVSRARDRLSFAPRRAADEEDVALSAFHSFCRGVEQGRFPRLDDRNDLRRVLLTILARKAAHLVRDELCEKRGGGRVRAEADLVGDEESQVLARMLGAEPTPEMALEMAEECQRLLQCLGDDELRSIALWQMEGCTIEEIAGKLKRTPRTVARKLAVIRDIWGDQEQDAPR